jgi:hypothetical protein
MGSSPTVFGLCSVELGQINVSAGQRSVHRLFVLVHGASQPNARLRQARVYAQAVRELNVQHLEERIHMQVL